MVLLIAARLCLPPVSWHQRKAHWLTMACAVGTIYRCIVPVLWEARPHGCLFATPGMYFGGELLDQVAAQIAECSFALLVAMQTALALHQSGAHTCGKIAGNVFLLIWLVARPCCWSGVTTDNKLFHVLEETAWTTYAAILAAMVIAALPWTLQCSHVRLMSKLILTGLVAYLWFMIRFDLPMYFQAWRRDVSTGFAPTNPVTGLAKMIRCDQVVSDIEAWRDAIPWQTGYFGVLPSVAVGLGIIFRPPLSAGHAAGGGTMCKDFSYWAGGCRPKAA